MPATARNETGLHRSRARSLARLLVRGIGAALVVLGLTHLAATPHIPALLDGLRGTPAYHWAVGPTLLNHVLVGVLLIPLGVSTWAAAAPENRRAGWTRTVLLTNAVAVLSMPLLLAVLMRDPVYYGSPLFLLGAALVAAVAVLLAVAVGLMLWGRAADPGTIDDSGTDVTTGSHATRES